MSRKGNGILLGLTTLLSAWAGNGQTMNTDSTYTSTITISSLYSVRDFTPDGDLNKNIWRHCKWVRFDHDMSGQHRYSQAETRVASCWTAAYVYFVFRCKYSTLNVYEGEDTLKERWELWNRDVAEVFINPDPPRVNHYYEFEVAPNNQWIDLEIDKTKTPFNDAAWDSHFEHATHIDAEKHLWTCEMRIPVSSMNAQPIQPDAEWRVNFLRADGSGDDSKRRFMTWSTIPEGKTFHVPTRFGIIKFIK